MKSRPTYLFLVVLSLKEVWCSLYSHRQRNSYAKERGIEKGSDFTSSKLQPVVTVVGQGLLSAMNVKMISYSTFHYCTSLERELLRNHFPSSDNFASGETASFSCSEMAGTISLWHACFTYPESHGYLHLPIHFPPGWVSFFLKSSL